MTPLMTVKQLEGFLRNWKVQWNWHQNNHGKIISMFQVPHEAEKRWVHFFEISPDMMSGELKILSLLFPRAGALRESTQPEVNTRRLLSFFSILEQFGIQATKKKEVRRCFLQYCQWPIQLAIGLSSQGTVDKIKIYASFNDRLRESQVDHAWEFAKRLANSLGVPFDSYAMFTDLSLDSVGLAVSRDNSWQLKIYPFWHQNFSKDILIKRFSRFVPNAKLREMLSSKTFSSMESLCTHSAVADVGLDLRFETIKSLKSWKVWVRFSPPIDSSMIDSVILDSDSVISKYFTENNLALSYMTWEDDHLGMYVR